MARLRDTDPTAMLQRVRGLPFAFALGGLTFAAAGLVARWPWYFALLAGGVAFLIVLLGPEWLAARSADAVADTMLPDGASTPALHQYSLADSLLARGKVAEAAEAYRALSADFPADAQPQIRLARLLRDHTGRFEEAASCYKHVLAIEGIDSGTEIAVTRELIELYTHKMKRPELALPYLAQFAQQHAEHPAAAWARSEYLDIKQRMQAQQENG